MVVVHTLDRNPGHQGVIGLHVGALNVQRHFPRDISHVELELDHLLIVCSLEPSFWHESPEIHDMRLSSWLEAKRSSGKIASQSASVAMIPCGGSSFRLRLMQEGETEAEHTETEVAFVSQIESPIASFDRRKRNLERKPERRKVDKLKGNAPSSTNH